MCLCVCVLQTKASVSGPSTDSWPSMTVPQGTFTSGVCFIWFEPKAKKLYVDAFFSCYGSFLNRTVCSGKLMSRCNEPYAATWVRTFTSLIDQRCLRTYFLNCSSELTCSKIPTKLLPREDEKPADNVPLLHVDLVQNAQLFQQLDLIKADHLLPTHEPLQSELTPPLLGSHRSAFDAHPDVIVAFRPGIEPTNRTKGEKWTPAQPNWMKMVWKPSEILSYPSLATPRQPDMYCNTNEEGENHIKRAQRQDERIMTVSRCVAVNSLLLKWQPWDTNSWQQWPSVCQSSGWLYDTYDKKELTTGTKGTWLNFPEFASSISVGLCGNLTIIRTLP